MTIETSARAKAPWHLWAAGGLGLLWNGFGAYDFTMSLTKGEAYFRSLGMSEAQIAYYDAMPGWMIVPWAVGVWGSVIGTVLLLLGRRWAFHAFVASLLGLLVSLVYTYVLSHGGEVTTGRGMVMSGVITAACLFFIWYAWIMTKRGALR